MTDTLNRRDLIRFAGAAAAAAPFGSVLAQADRPIKVVCITPPGAILDSTSRLIAQGLRARTGRTATVETRAGAGGNIATDFVAKSAADGSTILVTSNNHTTNAALYKSLPYDAEADLVPVAHVADYALVLVASPKSNIKTVSELVALAKAKPDAISVATGGNGSPGHIAAEIFKQLTGVRLQHVPYKGAAAAMTDALTGQVELAAGSLSSALPFIKSGQLRALAVTGQSRSASAPELPTFVEAGVKGYDYTGWIGVMAPRGTPASVVQSLHEAINTSMDSAEVRRAIEGMGGAVRQQTIAQFSEMLRIDFERNRKLIQALSLRVE
jgi:tripartite-type tricarboxylate transporter receptor subunit TctC